MTLPVTFALIVRIPEFGVADFNAYEDKVLPILKEHGGQLQQRFRTADGQTEIHILSFTTQSALDNYLIEPRRKLHSALLKASGAETELLKMENII